MARKYAGPPVTLRDVLAALRKLPHPLVWTVGFRPDPVVSTSSKAVVELTVIAPNGASYIWRRWGRVVSSTSQTAPFAVLLQAAQESTWYLEPYDDATLVKRVGWDLDVLVQTVEGEAKPSNQPGGLLS